MKTPINQAINDLQTQTKAGFVEVGNQLRAVNGRIDSQDTDNKIALAIARLKSEILGGASGAFDTLKELEDAINGGGTAAALADAVNKRVRFDEVMTLSDIEISNVLNTLKIDYSSVDFTSML